MHRLISIFLCAIFFTACQDTEAPEIKINAPGPEGIYNRSMRLPVNVIFYGAYDIQTIDYFLTDEIKGSLDVAELTPSFLVVNDFLTVDNLAPGTYELEFSAMDDAGNRNSNSTTFILSE